MGLITQGGGVRKLLMLKAVGNPSSQKLFKTLVHFKVRNGSRVLFWQDVWCGDNSLKTQFPDLFRMARSKDAMVHQMLSWNGEQTIGTYLL